MTRKEKATELALTLVGEGQNPQPLIDTLICMAKWESERDAVLDEDFVMTIYNFVNKWKNGCFGEISLQEALRRHKSEIE